MSDPVIIAMIASVTSTLATIATLVVSVRNGRKVEEVRHATNSMKDQLVAAAKLAGHAEGVAEQQRKDKS